jgi:orotate phosphoribosyltransferase
LLDERPVDLTPVGNTAAKDPRPMTASPRARLVDVIRARSLSLGPAMKLASGGTTTFYFDMKRTMFDPEGIDLIGDLVLDAVLKTDAEFVGGLEMGAVPIAIAVAMKSRVRGSRRIGTFFVRKEVKDHGSRRLIEGLAEGESLAGRPVVVLEDVTTTAGSAMKAINALREAGARIVAVVTVVDRLEGAEANLAREGLKLVPVLTAHDFGI